MNQNNFVERQNLTQIKYQIVKQIGCVDAPATLSIPFMQVDCENMQQEYFSFTLLAV